MSDLSRRVSVKAEELGRLLQSADPGGFLSNGLGVAWEDDGSGFARRLVEQPEIPMTDPELDAAIRSTWGDGVGRRLGGSTPDDL